MVWIKKIMPVIALCALPFLVTSCKIQLGLAPITSIDYNKVKTVSIAEFQNQSEYVYAPLGLYLLPKKYLLNFKASLRYSTLTKPCFHVPCETFLISDIGNIIFNNI